MYELVKVTDRTFYIECPAKMGLYIDDDGRAILIDSGGDKDAGRKVMKHLDENGWELNAIINTHSNADHIGGNRLIMNRTGAAAYTTRSEGAINEWPQFEPTILYGGYPLKALRNKFLMAKETPFTDIDEMDMPDGMEYFRLPGHFIDMIGIKTPDDVYFMADCVSPANILEKYHVGYIYDVAGQTDYPAGTHFAVVPVQHRGVQKRPLELQRNNQITVVDSGVHIAAVVDRDTENEGEHQPDRQSYSRDLYQQANCETLGRSRLR